jgi:hypothetical protein
VFAVPHVFFSWWLFVMIVVMLHDFNLSRMVNDDKIYASI